MARRISRRSFLAAAIAAGAGAVAVDELVVGHRSPRRLHRSSSGAPASGPASIADFGAKVDGVSVADGQISAGSATIASASGQFTQANATAGKPLLLTWSGGQVATSIASFVDAQHITAAVQLPANATGVTVQWATDDRAAFQAAIDAASADYVSSGTPQTLLVPAGVCYASPDIAAGQIPGVSYAYPSLVMKPGVVLDGAWASRLLFAPIPATLTTSDVTIDTDDSVSIPVVCALSFDRTLTPGLIQGYLPGKGTFQVGFTVADPTHFSAGSWSGLPSGTVIPAGTIIQQVGGWTGLSTDSPYCGGQGSGSCDDWQLQGVLIDGANAIGIENGACCGIAIGQASNYTIRAQIVNTVGKPVFSYPKVNTNQNWDVAIDVSNFWTNAASFDIPGSSGKLYVKARNCADPGGAEVAIIGSDGYPASHISAWVDSENWGNVVVSGDDIDLYEPNIVLPAGAQGPAIALYSGAGIRLHGGHLDVSASSGAGAIETAWGAVNDFQAAGTNIVCGSPRAVYAPPPSQGGTHSAWSLLDLTVTPATAQSSGCGAYIRSDGLEIEGCNVTGNPAQGPFWDISTSSGITFANTNDFSGVTVSLPPGSAAPTTGATGATGATAASAGLALWLPRAHDGTWRGSRIGWLMSRGRRLSGRPGVENVVRAARELRDALR